MLLQNRLLTIVSIQVLLFAATACRLFGQTGRATTWVRWEQALTSTRQYANAYRDVALKVTYTHSSGASVAGYGFWESGDTFKIRFMFPRTGTWTWETSCSDAANTGLHQKKGTVRVSGYEGTNPLYKNGYLKVSANRRYLTYANSQPFLWIGDTAWSAFIAASQPSWEGYLKDRLSKRFSVVMIHAGGGWVRRKEDTDGNPPFTGSDSSLAWNPAYWRGVDRKIQFANDSGMLILVAAAREGGPGFPAGDAAQVRLFGRNLAARLMGNFVVYSPVADDLAPPLADSSAAGVKEATAVHLVTAHPRFLWEPAATFHDKPYTDFAGVQTGAGWTYEPYKKARLGNLWVTWGAQGLG